MRGSFSREIAAANNAAAAQIVQRREAQAREAAAQGADTHPFSVQYQGGWRVFDVRVGEFKAGPFNTVDAAHAEACHLRDQERQA